MNNKEMHEKLLYPVVRIFVGKGAGSGTVIYSKPKKNKPTDYQTFILTNHHVIDDLVTRKEDWDSLLKRKVEKEFIEKGRVELFQYYNDSTVVSSNAHIGILVAYDQDHDLAIVELDSPVQYPFVAKIIDRDKIDELRLFSEVAVSGCSMAHEPFVSFGQLTFLKEDIDRRRYWMVNAGSYFGNSGGALFLRETGELIGVPSRLTGIQLGFGMDMVTFMGFSAHASRIYEFINEQELRFLYDPEDDYESAMERREEKRKSALMALKAEFVQRKEDTEGKKKWGIQNANMAN